MIEMVMLRQLRVCSEGKKKQLLPYFRHGATLGCNGGYHDTNTHPRPMDRIVTNATWASEQLATVYRLSGSSSPVDQPSAVADWIRNCYARPVAGAWAVDGLQR